MIITRREVDSLENATGGVMEVTVLMSTVRRVMI